MGIFEWYEYRYGPLFQLSGKKTNWPHTFLQSEGDTAVTLQMMMGLEYILYIDVSALWPH